MDRWLKTQPGQTVSRLFPVIGGGATSSSTPTVVSSGLVLHLDANNSSSYSGTGSTWSDISGSANHFTLVGSPTFTSGYFSFNGSSQTGYATSPAVNISGQITISTWVYFNSFTTNPIIIHKGYGYSTYFRNDIGTNYWTWADGSNYSYSNFGNRLASGLYVTAAWCNITVTKDASNVVRIYRDNVLRDSATFGSALTTYSSPTWLTGYADGTTAPTANLLNGRMAVVLIYNRTLTDAERTSNFDAYKSSFGVA